MNMTLTRPNLIKLLVPLLVFAATLVAVTADRQQPLRERHCGSGCRRRGGRSGDAALDGRSAFAPCRPPSPVGSLVRRALRGARRRVPPEGARDRRPRLLRARRVGTARRAAARARRRRARSPGWGRWRNARHDFRAGLRYGERAAAAAPGVVKPYGVIVDAQVELGRYDDAERTLQRMVDLKPNLDSYARVSYFRELHGDLRGAIDAMRLAASAGGDARENFAYVQTLLGNLELARGHTADAERAYRLARRASTATCRPRPGSRARASRAGDLDAAIRRYRRVVARLPMPEYVVGLAEAELAAGRRAAAREDLALVAVQQRLLRRGGVNVDAEMAIVEADHGSPARAVGAGPARATRPRPACAAPTRSAGR